MSGLAAPALRYDLPVSLRLPRLLAWITLALVLIHVTLQLLYHRGGIDLPYDLRLAFDVDEEASVPTWFNAIELFLASLLLLAIARDARRQGGRYVRHWFGLAIGFGLMSLDEIAGFHEGFNSSSNIDWTIPAAFLVLLLGVLYLRFIFHLSVRSRWLVLAAGAIYLGGALGVESLTTSPVGSLRYALMAGLEEGLEMSGVALFIHALLDYMSARQGSPLPGVAVDLGNERKGRLRAAGPSETRRGAAE